VFIEANLNITDKPRVLPGKTMAGNMGNHLHTVQNLEVIKVDPENGILLVKGPVSGPKKGYVKIQDAKKKPKMAADMGLPTMPGYLEAREAPIVGKEDASPSV
jgi:hypothetical protein